jgi:hypothetical protein
MIQSSEKIRPFFFGTRSKVLIMVFWALKTFDLLPRKERTDFGTRSKVENKSEFTLLKLLI